MKKVMRTRIYAIALVSILTLSLAPVALANDEKKVIPVELKYMGSVNQKPLFELSFSGPLESGFTVIVRDSERNILYRERVQGRNLTRRFLLNTDELGDIPLTFEVSANKTHEPAIFEVSKYSRVVENVVIHRNK